METTTIDVDRLKALEDNQVPAGCVCVNQDELDTLIQQRKEAYEDVFTLLGVMAGIQQLIPKDLFNDKGGFNVGEGLKFLPKIGGMKAQVQKILEPLAPIFKKYSPDDSNENNTDGTNPPAQLPAASSEG